MWVMIKVRRGGEASMKLLTRARLDGSRDPASLLTLLDPFRRISLAILDDIHSMKPNARPPFNDDPNRLFLFLLGGDARSRRNDTRRHQWIPIVIPKRQSYLVQKRCLVTSRMSHELYTGN